ncbi:methyl-accepting chemotaxis protein [Clostridium aciditolerans]|uniref:Chemotaxis protein n=1 Tax=Clostridium aciditolerans TaxID=339861 RepID=A0A934M0U2_9CLOT|nr:methyl-accepting chemotaxis protein [Clostridium aciditolerans]MBI6872534.1 chemotaxis protein [Clostridium aciditolerans]
MRNNYDNELFNAYSVLAPYLENFFSEDVLLSISDTEKYLEIRGNEKFNLNVKSGDFISKDGSDYQAIKTKKVFSRRIPKEAFGMEVQSMSIPVIDGSGTAIGTISIVKNLDRSYQISDLSKSLAAALHKISETTNNLSEGVQVMADSNTKITKNVQETNEEVKNTDEIISFVRNVANQTNLLGLNASIEAARAGESGRGFNVVAQEIRKLSTSSAESIKKIDQVLKKIQSSVSNVSENIADINDTFNKQASSFQEINALLQELSASAQILENIAKSY